MLEKGVEHSIKEKRKEGMRVLLSNGDNRGLIWGHLNEATADLPERNRIGSFLLSEDYYGKNATLLRIEKLAESLFRKIRKDPYYDATHDSDNKEINGLFAKLFNVEEFDGRWTPKNAESNAFTYPLSMIVSSSYSSYDVEKNAQGVRFKNPEGKIMVVQSFNALVTVTGITPAEWVAVILHEIGHNFYVTPYNYVASRFTLFKYILEVIKYLGGGALRDTNPGTFRRVVVEFLNAVLLMFRAGRRARSTVSRIIGENPILRPVAKLISAIAAIVSDIESTFYGFKNSLLIMSGKWLTILPRIVLGTIAGLAQTIIYDRYRDEKFADNFATSYGYGAEISSFVNKMEFNGTVANNVIQRIPVINELYNANTFMISSILGIADCHPGNYTRVADQAKLIRHELAKADINPSVRKQMQRDLDEIEGIYRQMNETEFLKENHKTFEAFANQAIRSMFGEIADVKELLLPTKDYDYNALKPQRERTSFFS
jgi:hypothetical protein